MNVPNISEVILFHRIFFPSELFGVVGAKAPLLLFSFRGENYYLEVLAKKPDHCAFYLSKNEVKWILGYASIEYGSIFLVGFVIEETIYLVVKGIACERDLTFDLSLNKKKVPRNLHKICKRIVHRHWKPKRVYEVHPHDFILGETSNEDANRIFWTKENKPLLLYDAKTRKMKFYDINNKTICVMQTMKEWIYTMVSDRGETWVERFIPGKAYEAMDICSMTFRRSRYLFRLYFWMRQIQRDLGAEATNVIEGATIDLTSLDDSQKESLAQLRVILNKASPAGFPFELTLEIFKYVAMG